MVSPGAEGRQFAERRAAPRPPAHRQWTPLSRALTVIGDKWTLAIVSELAPGRMRLSELRDLLGVGSSVLDRYVQQMCAGGLISRKRFREMPPRVEVELTQAGRELLPVAGALAGWGLRRAWSPPYPDEHVDLSALLRLLSLLADGSMAHDGLVELIVEDAGEPVCARFRVERSEVRRIASHDGTGELSARVVGSRGAWIAALSPGGRCDALRVTGDGELARQLLENVLSAA